MDINFTNNSNNVSRDKYTLFFSMIALIIMPVFGALDKMPIRLWDESRLATNAIEMARSNNWLVPTFGGVPDMWNTKPPLLIWMQAGMIKLIGINPLAIRLPVAFAVALTCIFLFLVLGKIVKDYKFSLMAVLVLVTTGAYITSHVARTGDYDGLLVLFTTLFSFSYFRYLTSFKIKYLYLFFLFLSLAVLTKSVEGLILLPELLVFTLLQGKLKKVICNKHLYLGIGMFVLLSCSYYLIREIYNPGYLRAVYKNELGGRFVDTIEGHSHPFYYYFEFRHYYYWLPLFLVGIVLGLRMKRSSLKEIVVFSIVLGLGYLFIISCSQTKLLWYNAPAFPFIAIVTALPVYLGYQYLKKRAQNKNKWKSYAPLGVLILLFLFPYYHIFEQQVLFPAKDPSFGLSGYLKGMLSGKNKIPITSIIIDDYEPQILFYVTMANEKGFHINHETSYSVKVGESVLVDKKEIIEKIKSRFNTKTEYDYNNVEVLYISSKKDCKLPNKYLQK